MFGFKNSYVSVTPPPPSRRSRAPRHVSSPPKLCTIYVFSEISIRLGSELLESFGVARSDDVQSAKTDLRKTLVELARKGDIKGDVSSGQGQFCFLVFFFFSCFFLVFWGFGGALVCLLTGTQIHVSKYA